FGVIPEPPAEFSPLAITRSSRCCCRSAGTSFLTALRPGSPTTSPMNNNFTAVTVGQKFPQGKPGSRQSAARCVAPSPKVQHRIPRPSSAPNSGAKNRVAKAREFHPSCKPFRRREKKQNYIEQGKMNQDQSV